MMTQCTECGGKGVSNYRRVNNKIAEQMPVNPGTETHYLETPLLLLRE
jgi:hypothetical protein